MENNNAPAENTPQNTETTENTTAETKTNAPQTETGKNNDIIAQKDAEIARLGKLLNQQAEKEKQRKDEEARQKWEFEKLYNEKNSEFEALKTEHSTQSEQITAYNTYFKQEFEKSIATLDAEKKQFIEKFLNGKSDFEKFSLLPEILKNFVPSVPSNVGNVPQGGNSLTNGAKTSVEELLKKGDIYGALKLRNEQK